MIRKTLPLAIAALMLAACERQPAEPVVADTAPQAAAPIDDQPHGDVPPATAPPEALASLRVALPAEGTISFEGFGPAKFGGTDEDVRIAWGADLGDAKPSEPGGCYYLTPQPLTEAGYRVAFMIEGDRFSRLDVRAPEVTAPGGGKVGMTTAQIESLYGGRVETLPHKYVEGAHHLRVTDPAGGTGVLVFETEPNGQVDAWRIGVSPQVDYVEGCS